MYDEATGKDNFICNQDLVRCHQCGIGLKDWIKDDDVLNEHVKHSSACDFLVQKQGQTNINRMNIALSNPGSANGNIVRDATSSNAAQLPYKIRSPRYQTMEARVASFQNFPQHIMISPQALAVSGLFYTGNGDLCRCFTCDGGLKDWSSGDDPVKEHAKQLSHCSYINQLKGQDYVQTQQQSRSSNEAMGATGGNSTVTRPTETSSSIPIDKLTIADPSYSSFHVSQVVEQCGYDKVDVITAKTELERKGNRFPTAQDIVNTILDMQESTANSEGSTEPRGSENDVQTLVEENERLSRQVYCKLYIDNEADILFLPCTHHRICHECAPNVTLCHVCNQFIKKKNVHLLCCPQENLQYGNGDMWRCITCNEGLKDWSSGDNPVNEHAKYLSHYSCINQLKGQEYVRTQQKSRSSNEAMGATGGNGTVTRPTETLSSIPIDELPIADLGYSSFDVSQVILKCGYDEIDVITEKTELERKDVQTIVEENKRLLRQVYCMQCMDSEADILFLPCTHHRICHECAQNVSFCPVCNQFIEEKVKTFRS